MVEPRHGARWEHPSGAHARMDEVEGMLKGKPVRQANLHVVVPAEHRRKGIATGLLSRAVRDLEEHNRKEPDQSKRFHNAFVSLATDVYNYGAAQKTFESAGFKLVQSDGANVFLQKILAHYQ